MAPDLVCLSHLRWDFVFQRPNHLMVHAARDRRVFFVEEPEERDAHPGLDITARDGVTIVRPHLPPGLSSDGRHATLEALLEGFAGREAIEAPWLWYYTPMALPWTRRLDASAVVYDCMDELSSFRGAPPRLLELEAELLARADVVFTGGMSLYEAKAGRHPRVHAMPSSVDVRHFASARQASGTEPDDQAAIPRPRIGYYGVIDERIDRELIAAVARARPAWQLILLGPVAKLAPDEVPAAPNIHALGMKRYDDLPDYLRGWDVAMMPFALNDATRYISPTKTPEYLAGGKAVVSTPVRDVVEPYGRLGIVRIAESAEGWVAAIEDALREGEPASRDRVDELLRRMSWEDTWARMDALVESVVPRRRTIGAPRVAAPRPRLGLGSARSRLARAR